MSTKKDLQIIQEVYDLTVDRKTKKKNKNPKKVTFATNIKGKALSRGQKPKPPTRAPMQRANAQMPGTSASSNICVTRTESRFRAEELGDDHFGLPELRPGSYWSQADKQNMECAIKRMLFALEHQQLIAQQKNEWELYRTLPNDDVEVEEVEIEDEDDDDEDDVDDDEDDDWDESILDDVHEAVKSEHPQLLRYFEVLGKYSPQLAIRIAQACLTGVKENGDKSKNWHFF